MAGGLPAPEAGRPPWPGALERTADGLTFAGRRITEIAPTPVTLLDESEARGRAAAWVSAIGEGDVYYAGKAFLTPTFAAWMSGEGLRIDTASEGELRVALAGGVPGEHIGLHGNWKSDRLLALALEEGVGRIVVDSLSEIDRLAALASSMGVVAPCFVRVTTGVHAGGHDFIATAHEDQKFGLSIATGAAARAVEAIAGNTNLKLVGIHSHIGSQILDPSGFVAAASRVIEFIAETGVPVAEVDLGGGYGIQYTGHDPEPTDPAEMIAMIRKAVGEACARAEVPVPRLSIEPGRSIVGPAGVTVYTVGTVKPVMTDEGERLYVSVDGGMSDNIRPALYGASYTAMMDRASRAPLARARVVGLHCESGDIVVHDVALPSDIRPGDTLVVAATGAYGRSMASNYNLVPRPGVLALGESGETWLVAPEMWEDVASLLR